MKKELTHTQKQFRKWLKYNRACKDIKKRNLIFKQVLILNARLGKCRGES